MVNKCAMWLRQAFTDEPLNASVAGPSPASGYAVSVAGSRSAVRQSLLLFALLGVCTAVLASSTANCPRLPLARVVIFIPPVFRLGQCARRGSMPPEIWFGDKVLVDLRDHRKLNESTNDETTQTIFRHLTAHTSEQTSWWPSVKICPHRKWWVHATQKHFYSPLNGRSTYINTKTI